MEYWKVEDRLYKMIVEECSHKSFGLHSEGVMFCYTPKDIKRVIMKVLEESEHDTYALNKIKVTLG